MEKKIKLNGGERTFKMSAAVPRLYRQHFNEDIMTGMYEMQDRLFHVPKEEREFTQKEETMLENLAYICNKHADPSQPEEIIDWLSSIDLQDVGKCIGAVIELWNADNQQLSASKKKNEER